MGEFFRHLFDAGLSKELVVFISALFPLWEVKGAIILGQSMGIAPWASYCISEAASNLSAIALLLFLKPVMNWMYTTRALKGFAAWLEKRGMRKSEKVARYESLGLFLFVAVPLPTTGVWTGSLIGTVLDMPLKRTIPAVIVGNLVAGLAIMLVYGVIALA